MKSSFGTSRINIRTILFRLQTAPPALGELADALVRGFERQWAIHFSVSVTHTIGKRKLSYTNNIVNRPTAVLIRILRQRAETLQQDSGLPIVIEKVYLIQYIKGTGTCHHYEDTARSRHISSMNTR